MRGTLDGEALDAGRERDGPGDARAGAFDGIGNFTRRLVYDTLVISLKPNSDALGSHTKNNFLLMVSINLSLQFLKADGEYSNEVVPRNKFF
jgi:hypothetical protein